MRFHSENVPRADNQQETSQNFYYTGFCSGEMSCSLLRISNKKSKANGVYYSPDITISNADISLLKEVNQVVAGERGVASPIKGGYNLSIRGKDKVKRAFVFFEKYLPIVGDLTLSKLALLSKGIKILENRKGYRRSSKEQEGLEKIRKQFVYLKKTAIPAFKFSQKTFNKDAIGYFLSGVLDAEGSVGMKTNWSRKQPFIAIAMKDKKIVYLFKDFLGCGHIHFRRRDNLYHFEIGSRKEVLRTLTLFLEIYPSKLLKMKRRMEKLRWILNDYTQRSTENLISGYDIV